LPFDARDADQPFDRLDASDDSGQLRASALTNDQTESSKQTTREQSVMLANTYVLYGRPVGALFLLHIMARAMLSADMGLFLQTKSPTYSAVVSIINGRRVRPTTQNM
jgi:hypothetical protein